MRGYVVCQHQALIPLPTSKSSHYVPLSLWRVHLTHSMTTMYSCDIVVSFLCAPFDTLTAFCSCLLSYDSRFISVFSCGLLFICFRVVDSETQSMETVFGILSPSIATVCSWTLISLYRPDTGLSNLLYRRLDISSAVRDVVVASCGQSKNM